MPSKTKAAIQQREDVSDGEIVLARYQESASSDIKTLLCIYYEGSTDTGWTFIGGLRDEFEKTEEIIAQALSDLDGRLVVLEQGSSFTETDPVFTASPAYGITSNDITEYLKQKTIVRFSEDNGVFSFTDASGSALTHSYVKSLIENNSNDIVFIRDDDTVFSFLLFTDSTSFAIFSLTDYSIERYAFYWYNGQYTEDEHLNTRFLTSDDEEDYVRSHFQGVAHLHEMNVVTKTPSSSVTINPYVFNNFGTVSIPMTIVFNTSSETAGKVKEYTIRFVAGSGCAITLPNGVLYANGTTPTYTAGHTYEINIINNCAVVGEFY